jgi:hypothetical protein
MRTRVIPGTRFVFSSITLALLLLSTAAGSEDNKPFQAGKASDYAHQSSEQVLVGAKAFDTQDLTAEAFGKKVDLLKYGVLPVLVVIENKRDRSIDLNNLEVNLTAADGRHVAPVSPDDIPFVASDGKRRPKTPGTGLPIPLPKKKNPLGGPEILVRAFAAKMVPPGDSVSGFFYFEAEAEPGDSVYLSGMRDARNGKEILYFEFPLKKDNGPAK